MICKVQSFVVTKSAKDRTVVLQESASPGEVLGSLMNLNSISLIHMLIKLQKIMGIAVNEMFHQD